MKRLLAVIIPLVVIIGGYFIWTGVKRSENQQSPYRLGAVDNGVVQVVVTATGTVSAVTTVTVGSQVSGTLKAILVDFNSPVKKGQIIARLDPTFLQASVSESEANLERAQAGLSQAKRDMDRISDLASKNLAAQADVDNAKTAVETAEANLKQMKAQLQRAKVNLDYSIIQSPIDGTVISRSVDVGQTVAASLQAPTLFTIAQDLRKMQIETSIDEADIGRLEEGMDASFTVDSYPDLTFHAKIGQIRYASEVQQSVVTYPVILKVDNPELKLRPGMTANVTVVTSRRDEALRIPASALRFRPPDYKPGKEGGAGKPATGGALAAQEQPARSDSAHAWGHGRHGGGAKSDSTSAANGSHRATEEGHSMALVFVKNKDGQPEARRVSIGINDGSYVELVGRELSPGDSVIIGMSGTSAAGVKTMPGMGGGGGPRR